MKRAGSVVCILTAFIACGAALAQEAPNPEPFLPEWSGVPSVQDFVRHYPEPARQQSQQGIAILCCTPRADRSASCRVGAEWPAGWEFGAAALRISEHFQISPASYERYRSDSGNWMQVPVVFRMDGLPAPDMIERVQRDGRDMCRPTLVSMR